MSFHPIPYAPLRQRALRWSLREITSSGDRRRFFQFPHELYRGDRYWVPPLFGQRFDVLRPPAHPSFVHLQVGLFMAESTGAAGRDHVIGTIAALIDERYNAQHHENAGFFGLFEVINDGAVAAALLGAAEEWVSRRLQSPVTLHGPVRLGALDGCGILADGFNARPLVFQPYNPPYYPELIETAGFEVSAELLSYRWASPLPPSPSGAASVPLGGNGAASPFALSDAGLPPPLDAFGGAPADRQAAGGDNLPSPHTEKGPHGGSGAGGTSAAVGKARTAGKGHAGGAGESLRVRPADPGRLPADLARLARLYNRVLADRPGFVAMADAGLERLAAGLMRYIDPALLFFLEDRHDVTGFCLALPDLNTPRYAARYWPFPISRLRAGLAGRRLAHARVFPPALLPQYRTPAAVRLLLSAVFDAAVGLGYRDLEFACIPAGDPLPVPALSELGAMPFKTYALYEKRLSG